MYYIVNSQYDTARRINMESIKFHFAPLEGSLYSLYIQQVCGVGLSRVTHLKFDK